MNFFTGGSDIRTIGPEFTKAPRYCAAFFKRPDKQK